MKATLGLAADFLDRLANPAHGAQVNEEYAIRLGELLDRDPGFLERALTDPELSAGDVDLLSTSGWHWYLSYLRGTTARPPDALLDELWDTTPTALMRLQILELVTAHPATVERFGQHGPPSPEELPDRWLATRLLNTLRAERESAAYPAAIELVLMLLQVGNRVALETARVMLSHEWPGQGILREQTGQLFAELDVETQRAWFTRLGL